MTRNARLIVTALLSMTFVAVAAGALVAVWSSESPGFADQNQSSPMAQELSTATNLSAAFNQAARTIRPSVVSIRSVARLQPAPRGQRRPELPEEFRRFFEDDLFDRLVPQVPEGGLEQRGLGSGVIVSRDGYIVTNNHVIRGANEIDVTLFDGRTLAAKVVGADAKTDLAVLQVEARGLTPARLGDSDALQVGDWVLAIGTPFELEQTVTAGIVSAKSRSAVGLTDYEDFIQTDAAINPGNSGGPLVNLQGEVVGINTAIASRTGGYMGIGFAIPSSMVQLVKDAIVTTGKVQRGRLGALVQDLDEDLARSFGFSSTKGVLIGDVVPDSPAQRAGLKSGDIVTRYNGQEMRDANQLRNRVAATAPGTRVEMVYYRDGKQQTVQVQIGELEDDEVTVNNGAESADQLGLTVETLNPETARQLGFEANQQGAVVTRVAPGSLADRAGLQPGDLIVALGNQPVRGSAEFRQQVQEQELSQGIRLTVERDGARRFVFLKSRQ